VLLCLHGWQWGACQPHPKCFLARQAFEKVGRLEEWRIIEQWLTRWSSQNTGPVLHHDFAKVCKMLNEALEAHPQVSPNGSLHGFRV